MYARTEWRKVGWLSGGIRRMQGGTLAVFVQALLFFALGAAVLVGLVYDLRLYYGIGANGQPLYKEGPSRNKADFGTNQTSAERAPGKADSGRHHSPADVVCLSDRCMMASSTPDASLALASGKERPDGKARFEPLLRGKAVEKDGDLLRSATQRG